MIQANQAESIENMDLILAAYLKEVAKDGRVLWIGRAQQAAVDRLLTVVDFIQVLEAKREPRRGSGPTGPKPRGTVRRSALRDEPLSFRDPFDVVVVTDVALLKRLEDRVEELADLVADDGVIALAARADGDLSYHALYELVATHFEHVKMLGEVPFQGASLLTFGEAADEIVLDGDFMAESPAPTHFVAFGFDPEAEAKLSGLDAWTLVQLPGAAPVSEVRAEKAPLTEAQAKELADVREAEAAAKAAVEQAQRDAQRARNDAAEAKEALDRAKAELKDAERAKQDLSAARDELKRAQGMRKKLEDELDQADEQLEVLEERLDEASQRLRFATKKVQQEQANEYGALEKTLREQGRELAEARAEIERRGILVRDLVEQLKEGQLPLAEVDAEFTVPTPATAGHVAGTDASTEGLRRRITQLEAEKAAGEFELDELQGRLLEADSRVTALQSELGEAKRRGSDTQSSSGAQAASEDLAGVELEGAELQGTVRGLRARLAEAEELRSLAEARATLLHDDVMEAKAKQLDLERRMVEEREQFELEWMRARSEGTSPEVDEVRESEARERRRVHELKQELSTVEDRLERTQVERDAAQAQNRALTEKVTVLEERLEAQEQRFSARLHADHAAMERIVRESQTPPAPANASLEAEIVGLRMRLADRDAALRSLAPQGDTKAVGTTHALRDRIDDLMAELEQIRARESQLALSLAELQEDHGRTTADRADLSASLAARDALVSRLQLDLVESERHAREAERALTQAQQESARLREAVVSASDSVDKADEARVRIKELEAELDAVRVQLDNSEQLRMMQSERAGALQGDEDRTRDALDETRRTLASLADSLGVSDSDRPGAMSGADLFSSGGPASEGVAALRQTTEEQAKQLASLEEQMRAKDALIRSLQAGRVDGAPDAQAAQATAALERALEDERRARQRAESLANRSVREVGHTDTVSHLREELEALLGSDSAKRDPFLASRIGKLIQGLE